MATRRWRNCCHAGLRRAQPSRIGVTVVALVMLAGAAAGADLSDQVLRPGSFVVHVGTTDGAAEIALAKSGATLVQGLAMNGRAVAAARQAIAGATDERELRSIASPGPGGER
jgi:hypothetical protein